MRPIILYIDDEKANLDTFRRVFCHDYDVIIAISGETGLETVKREDVQVAVVDQKMPGMSGITFCETICQSHPYITRIILTAFTDTQILLDAIQRGHVQDYIVKPWKKEELKPVLDKAVELYKDRYQKFRQLEKVCRVKDSLEAEVDEIYDFEGLIGAEAGLAQVVEKIKKVAATNSTVLLLGESGTGKELLARAVHKNSERKDGPFVPVHCAALAENLLESELFGHERGAFTGAEARKIGRFEMANGGTIFLDEISEIPETVQTKLLRVLQEKEIERVGGTGAIKTDVRVVAATNKNLEEMVKTRRFREDLYFRINVIPVRIPSLNERKEDIPKLIKYYEDKFSRELGKKTSFTNEAAALLADYDWPGNVRELKNIIERAMVMADGETIGPDDLSFDFKGFSETRSVNMETLNKSINVRDQIKSEEVEKLKRALLSAKGNISDAARALNLPRSTVFNKLKKYHLI